MRDDHFYFAKRLGLYIVSQSGASVKADRTQYNCVNNFLTKLKNINQSARQSFNLVRDVENIERYLEFPTEIAKI